MGPVLLTDTISELCHVGRGTNSSLLGSHSNCGISVLNHTHFYPVKHVDRTVLFQSQSDKFWEALFGGSVSVHFYGSNTSGRFVVLLKGKDLGSCEIANCRVLLEEEGFKI